MAVGGDSVAGTVSLGVWLIPCGFFLSTPGEFSVTLLTAPTEVASSVRSREIVFSFWIFVGVFCTGFLGFSGRLVRLSFFFISLSRFDGFPTRNLNGMLGGEPTFALFARLEVDSARLPRTVFDLLGVFAELGGRPSRVSETESSLGGDFCVGVSGCGSGEYDGVLEPFFAFGGTSLRVMRREP